MISKSNCTESYTFFGFVFLFVIFSLSSFQLPHYLNALFPFLSILTAEILLRYAKNKKFLKVFYHVHIWESVLLLVAVIVIHFIFSNRYPNPDIYIVFLIGIFVMVLLMTVKGHKFNKILFIPAITILLVNYYINRSFYPQLLRYQAESEVALYMKEHNLEEQKLLTLGVREEIASFLQNRIIPTLELNLAKQDDLSGNYIFTNKEGMEKIKSLNLHAEIVQSFPDFRITTLNGTFLNKKTRNKELEMKFLLYVE